MEFCKLHPTYYKTDKTPCPECRNAAKTIDLAKVFPFTPDPDFVHVNRRNELRYCEAHPRFPIPKHMGCVECIRLEQLEQMEKEARAVPLNIYVPGDENLHRWFMTKLAAERREIGDLRGRNASLRCRLDVAKVVCVIGWLAVVVLSWWGPQ